MNEQVTEPIATPVTSAPETPSENPFDRHVGITEAAHMTGRNKGQISKDTSSKRLPYIVNEAGHKRYKLADLYNLYGFRQPGATQENKGLLPVEKPQDSNPENLLELATLRERVKAQEEMLRRADEERRRIEDENRDLRQTRDRLLDQNNRLTLLLPAPPTAAQEQTSSPTPAERKPFWKRFFA